MVKKYVGSGSNNLYWSGLAKTGHVIGAGTGSLPDLISDAQMDSDGASAMSRTMPTSPEFSLLTASSELFRDGIPSIIGSTLLKNRARHLRKLPGDEYLNIEFGWKPLIADLRSFCNVVNNSNKILQNYKENSGKQIRRAFNYPETYSVQDWTGNTILNPTALNEFGNGVTIREQKSAKWYEGVFKYHVPDVDNAFDKAKYYASLANHLLGIKPSPENIWNAAPWSWAADWFTNTGDILTNASALGTDGLQMVYGYEMCSQENIVRTYSHVDVFHPGNKPVRYNFSYEEQMVSKQRRPANPYGFGVSGLATTTRQKAIAAALALSMSGGKAK
jgi:hypothetical protein